MSLPTVSLTLKRLCEVFLQERSSRHTGSEKLCGRHKQKVKFFCLADEQPVCLLCRDSRRHKGHTFCLIDEVVQDRKESLKAELETLKEKLELYTEAKLACRQTEKYILTQAAETHQEMKKQFHFLYTFLLMEEKARINGLIEEEKEKTRVVKEKIDKINNVISSLLTEIRAVEEHLDGDHVTMLQRYHAVPHKTRTQCMVPDPQLDSGSLLDVAKHLGNLQVKVWEKLKGHMKYYPVILDPNTAHRDVLVDPDMATFRIRNSWERQEMMAPDNPERFNLYEGVLGSEGFDSGTHSWDVEVREPSFGEDWTGCEWALGVVGESSLRKGVIKTGGWRLDHQEGAYSVRSVPEPPIPIVINSRQRLRRIRVTLDWDGGQLTFSDPDNNERLHTFTHTFSEKVFPYLSNGSDLYSLRILPGNIQEQVCGQKISLIPSDQ
uniref:B30.2/SPRY domain-containing protein n=2 Tax=Esox lucius TaxID=8010 RepID=A0A3P8Z0D1_ESOLU